MGEYGRYYIQYAGKNCSPAMYLTAATNSDVITDEHQSGDDSSQIWLLTPILIIRNVPLAGWRISPQSKQSHALQCPRSGPLTTAPYEDDRPEFLWSLIPSKNRGDCFNIQCYNYSAHGDPFAMDVVDYSCAPRTTVQGNVFKDNAAQQFQLHESV
jgi:hypothetical protein